MKEFSTTNHLPVKNARANGNVDILVAALAPIVSRVRTSTCCVRNSRGVRRVQAALSADRLAHHVNGGPAYGVYPMEPGTSTTRVALFDLDSHKGETPWPDMQHAALAVVAALEARGLRPIPFRSSGGAGIHLYVLWDEPQDAHSVRSALRSALTSAGYSEGTGGVSAGQVEIFPKQDSVPADGFGNMFVLPLAGKSVPLDAFELDDMPKDYAAQMEWSASGAVPIAEATERAVSASPMVPVGLAHVAELVDAIPNSRADELPYEDGPEGRSYLELIIAIYRGCGGSEDGRALAHRLAARSSKYNAADVDKRYDSVTDRENNGITVRTLEAAARYYGYGAPGDDEFEALPLETSERPLPRFRRNDKGEILACLENAALALADPWFCGVHIGFDQFHAGVMLARCGTSEWHSLTDADYTRLQIHLEQRSFRKLTREMMREAVWLVADNNQFDSAVLWLRSLHHDGVARIDTFLARYMGAQDSPYTRAVSRYIWTALAGRVLEPGCEAPMVPVLIGAQGCGKTRSVKAIAPAPEFYTELNLADRDSEASRRMRGRLVIELGELRGLHSRDAESIKAFISRTSEEWRALYKEFNTTFARRFLFVGTTNQDEFLDDESGERRWLPVSVSACDVEAVQRDCLQLWAEAREATELGGVDWKDAETLAREMHAQHKITDPWTASVAQWLGMPDEFDQEPAPETREFLRVHEVATGALQLDAKALGKREEMRIGKCLQRLGYERAFRYDGPRRIRVWVKATGTT